MSVTIKDGWRREPRSGLGGNNLVRLDSMPLASLSAVATSNSVCSEKKSSTVTFGTDAFDTFDKLCQCRYSGLLIDRAIQHMIPVGHPSAALLSKVKAVGGLTLSSGIDGNQGASNVYLFMRHCRRSPLLDSYSRRCDLRLAGSTHRCGSRVPERADRRETSRAGCCDSPGR